MIIREKDKKRLQAIFSQCAEPMEVWAYGSRVDGSAHEGSDLDLVIRSANLQKLPPQLLRRLQEIIRLSNIPILVELRGWTDLPSNFQAQIEKQYVIFFSSLPAGIDK